MRTVAYWLSLILIFMIPWENAVTVAGLGTLTRVTGLLVAAVWVGALVVTGRFRKPHQFHMAVFVFVLWNTGSVFWSFSVEETVERIETYFQLAGLVLLLWDLYTTPAALNAGLQAYVLGAHVAVGSTVYNYLAGKEAFAYSGGRYTGAGLNAGDLALILTLGLPVAWHLTTSAGNGIKSYILKPVNYAYIPVALFAILLTAARMALFAAIPAVLFVLGTSARVKPLLRILISVVSIGALFALQPYVPQSSRDRLTTTSASIAERDLGGRAAIWRESIAVFSEDPLLGVGSGALSTTIESGSVAHNTFLSVLAELGMIGFLLFAVMLAVAVYQAIRQPKWHSRLWLTVLTVWLIGVSAQTWEHRKPTWLFLSLVVVGAGLSTQRDESTHCSEFPVGRASLWSLSVVRPDMSTSLDDTI